MNLPDYNFLSAPLELITVLHIVTLSLHFIAMNFMVGGVIVILWGGFGNRWNDPTVKTFVKLFPSIMALTITLGVAPLLFLQLVYGKQVYPAAIVSGWFWLMVVPAVIISYYAFYWASFSTDRNYRKIRMALRVGLLGMLYVSLVYSSVFSMAEQPEVIKSLYMADQSGMTFNPDVNSYFYRWLHMIMGALMVGGFFVALLGRSNEQAFKVGKQFYLWGMIVASLSGMTYLLKLGEVMLPFTRNGAFHFLILGILLSLGSIHFLFKKHFLIAGSMLFVSLTSMVTARHTVRVLRLAEYFDPTTIPIKPLWSVFGIFLVCFILALGMVAYMFRLYFKSQTAG